MADSTVYSILILSLKCVKNFTLCATTSNIFMFIHFLQNKFTRDLLLSLIWHHIYQNNSQSSADRILSSNSIVKTQKHKCKIQIIFSIKFLTKIYFPFNILIIRQTFEQNEQNYLF